MPKKKGADGKVNLEYGRGARNFSLNKAKGPGSKVNWEKPARTRSRKKGS